MNNKNLTYFDFENIDKNINYKLFIKTPDNNNLLNELELELSNIFNDLKTIWLGCDDNFKKIYKNFRRENNDLTIALKINEPPFSYLDSNGENIGLIVDLLYHFANSFGYNLNIINLEKNNNINQLFQENENISISGFLSFNESYENEIIIKNIFNEEIKTVVIIRKENYNNNNLLKVYESIDKFNNENLGTIDETYELTRNYFNDAKIQIKDDVYNLFNSLLMGEINGFIIDELTSMYYSNKVNERFVHFPNIIGKNYFGFIFDNEKIKNQFKDELN